MRLLPDPIQSGLERGWRVLAGSFRTPRETPKFWRERFELPDLTDDTLSRWFLQAEQRLHIHAWAVPPNPNNDIQFAAGALTVSPAREMAAPYRNWAQARQAVQALQMKPYLTRVVSAHLIGGCGMAGRADLGVVRPDGRHWQLQNLSVHDGSLFPTSIGANPQLSVYGLVAMLASGLAREPSGRSVALT